MSISEPFALASYKNHLYASANVDNVSVAVQSDGVHVHQLSTLRPIISHTLGPSTEFACPPLTLSNAHIHTVYAAIHSSSEIDDEQAAGKTIWVWSEDLNSTLADRAEAHKKKLSMTVPHTIGSLHYVPELPENIIALSPRGATTILNLDPLQVGPTLEPQNSNTLLKSFVHPRAECSFLPPRVSPQTGAVVVLVLADPETGNARIEVVCVTTEERESPFVLIGNCQMDFKPTDLLDISCSSSGYLSVLATDGEWLSLILGSEGESFNLSQATDPIRLKNIQFDPKSVALLPLTSSHVLLAGISPSAAEINIHMWDHQYSVILASHALSIPSSLTSLHASSSISLALIPSAPPNTSSTSTSKEKSSPVDAQALLIISSHSSANKPLNARSKSKSRASHSSTATPSTIFVVPYVVPCVSTIGNAIGRAGVSAPWIALPDQAQGEMHDRLDQSRRDVLKAMRTAVEGNRPQAANEEFFEWVKRHVTPNTRSMYGYQFVKQVLDAVLQPAKDPASVMYSSEIIKYLLDRKVVSNGMVEGGLVRTLKAKNDWASIKLALMNVVDVSESEFVEALWDVVIANQGNQPRRLGPDSMQVDNPSDSLPESSVPSLPAFLSYCVKYPSTPSQLRLAIRQQQLRPVTSGMTAAECAVDVLRILIRWIKDWARRDLPMLAGVKKSGIAEGVTAKNADKIPELRQIVSFTETFLDATFLALLQHKPAEHFLRRLTVLLEQEVSFTESVQSLYGALESFSKAHKKSLKDAEGKGVSQTSAGKAAKTAEDRQGDWRQRKKRVREQAEMAVQLYQVEELFI